MNPISEPQPSPDSGLADTRPDDAGVDTPAVACENCGQPLLGGHCYACGQPRKGLVRHFSSILGDFADTVLNIDSRIFRSVGPLLFRPGFLSQEYFAGRRVRYVSPVRLFVFLSITTFVIAQWAMPDWSVSGDGASIQVGIDGGGSDFANAKTVADVEAQRDKALAGLEEAIKNGGQVPGLAAGMREGQKEIRAAAARRIAQIKSGKPVKPSSKTDDDLDDLVISGDKPWDPVTNPIRVDWLPDAGNAQLNALAGRLKDNGKRIKKDPNLLKAAVFNALPTTLFVLVPVFALLLKLFYVFKRRLYMEHLIVALHSHAFLCLAVISLIGLGSLETGLGNPAWLGVPMGLAEFAMAVWMPLYLLLMQKRIYGQGWPMTLLKFGALGFIHLMLLSFGVICTLVAAAIWL